MFRTIAIFIASAALAMALGPMVAFADSPRLETAGPASDMNGIATVQTQDAKPMNLRPTYGAYLTNGKGSAYRSYKSSSSPFKNQPLIYKARIKNGKLYLSGTYSKNSATAAEVQANKHKVKNKAFKLSAKAKYYRHVGNNSFYEKQTRAQMKTLLASKSASAGGDISFTVKKGKITLLIAQ
ncbi:MAG TPA: hypothetical protein DCP91_05135 [Eggerthellaceae bacterium]|nr:hypothetical protein [Eggerthellaceae bacterium]